MEIWPKHYKIGFEQNERTKNDLKMTNLKAGSVPTNEFRDHKLNSFSALRGGRLTGAWWTPSRHSRGSILQKEAFRDAFGASNWLVGGVWYGPQTGCPAYIYICICCEVIIWAKFGHFRCYYLGQVGVIIWAKLFLGYKNSGFKRFFAHTVII